MMALWIIAFVLLLSSVVQSGEIMQIDFLVSDRLVLDVPVRDGFSFDLYDGRHVVVVDRITESGADLDIFMFAGEEDQAVQYATAKKDTTVKLDPNRDGEGDVYIKLISIKGNHNDIARLVLFTQNAIEEQPMTGGEVAIQLEEKNFTPALVFISIIGILVLLLLFFSFRKKEK